VSRFFISYRRQDTAAEAGRIHDLLSQHFSPDETFMDVDTVPPGVDFKRRIERHLGECHAVLAIIGNSWQEVRDSAGRRRLEAPDDLLRFEIESALARGVTVIPVLVDGAVMPPESALPESIRPLGRLQAIRIDTSDFHRDAQQLLKILEGVGPRRVGWAWVRPLSVAILALLVTGTAVLSMTRVAQAPVEIRIRASQVAFRLGATGPAVGGISLARLGVAGSRDITMPGEDLGSQSALLLDATSTAGRISLPPLVLPAGARVWLQRGAVVNEMQIGLQGPAVDFHASVDGAIRVGPADAKAFAVTFDTPGRIRFRAEPGDVVELTAVPADGGSVSLSREVSIDSLSLAAVEEATLGDDPVVRPVSAIEEGTVDFWPGSGPRRELESGDWVRIWSPQGQLKVVAFEQGMFDLRFAGTVQDLQTGSPVEPITAMPTYLEALWANYRQALLVAILIVLGAGLLMRRRRLAARAW
jgi:hypothetical protein